MATWDFVEPELAQRGQRVILLGKGRLWLSEGFRTRAQQQYFRDLYLRGQGPIAAVPGTSDHEKMPARAIDIGAVKGAESLRQKLFADCGLITKVVGEPWHATLDPKRGLLPPLVLPTIREAEGMIRTPVVGIHATKTGQGYWIVATDGGVFAKGDAVFYGSMGGKPLNGAIVRSEVTHSGEGYYLIGSDGGVFAFGDAQHFGSMANEKLAAPISGFSLTPSGKGYWLTGADGGVFAFGDAPYCGNVIDLVKG